ncbi:hypothetical protein TSAR_008970 [Trichomalopsis sarcophagae]|uniref:Uncharacterized protein n=1 Tax=Trichomalopsis sarcophagae TaxID=543379 RepID=A0A232FCX7_9HYME|nr:hypothetical protein TSAR_008970 [Trichomalopsis sarcophagae]
MSQEMSPPAVPVANGAAAAASPGIETMIAVVGALLLLLVICKRHRWYYVGGRRDEQHGTSGNSRCREAHNAASRRRGSQYVPGTGRKAPRGKSRGPRSSCHSPPSGHEARKSQARKLTFIDQSLNDIDSHLLILRNAALAQEAACSIPASIPV